MNCALVRRPCSVSVRSWAVVWGREVDVLIVGARIAGATLAATLGGLGWTVLVVDRATFPSPTLSTHFFRGAGLVGVLRDLGVLDDVLACGPPPLTCEYEADALADSVTVASPQDPGSVGYCLSVRRQTLDAIVVHRARREPTVEVLEGVSVVRLVDVDGRIVGAQLDCEPAAPVRARYVIGADGRGSHVAKQVGAQIQEQHAASRAMYYRYAEGMPGPNGPRDGPEFSLGDDELAYVFPSDGGTACVAVSINVGAYEVMRPRARTEFGERLSRHPFLAPRLADVRWSGRLMGCGPRPAVARVPVGPGWALVGDAALVQDPWTGLGMDNAAIHATLLAETLDAVLSGRTPEHDAMADYHRRRDEHALAGFRMTSTLGRDLNSLRSDPVSGTRS